MPTLKPAYLIHGDDHGGVAERRASLKALAEQQGGAEAVEILIGEQATPQGVAGALMALTFALGQRVIIVDGVERWKQAEVERDLSPAMQPMPPDTTLALFAREEGKTKAPASLHRLVKAAGGQIVCHSTVKPWELPGWVRTQGARLGLQLDVAASKALIAQVGERQQRLLRELEKIALELGEPGEGVSAARMTTSAAGATTSSAGMTTSGATTSSAGVAPTKAMSISVSVEDVERRASHSSQRRAYTLADALVGGDVTASLRAYLSLESQGERLPSLSYPIASRLREALVVSRRLQSGEPPKEIARSLRMPGRAAERFVADVGKADAQRLSDGLARLADLEVDLRGGAQASFGRRPEASLSEQTVAVLTIQRIAGERA